MSEPLVGKYLVRNRAANFCLRGVDVVLSLCLRSYSPNLSLNQSPRRILLANSAHLGDVVILSSVLPVLKKAFPEAKIGLLIGSWSLPVVQGNSMIDWVHTVDHWKLNRSDGSMWQKLKRYWRTRRAALDEIRNTGYDVAVDLYSYFPNFIPLLWQTGIPVRIGYISGGFGPLLTHPLRWRNLNQHVSSYHADLLQMLPIDKKYFEKLHYFLPPIDHSFEEEADSFLREASVDPAYIIIHMGTGERLKEWPVEKWHILSKKLTANGYSLVFTGYGSRESENARLVTAGLSNCVNLCSKLNWGAFVSIVKKSRLVICVESLAGHIAAAVDTHCVLIRSGMTNYYHWRPMSGLCQILMRPVSCAPCYRSRGCATMDCVRDVRPDDVYSVALKMLGFCGNSTEKTLNEK